MERSEPNGELEVRLRWDPEADLATKGFNSEPKLITMSKVCAALRSRGAVVLTKLQARPKDMSHTATEDVQYRL